MLQLYDTALQAGLAAVVLLPIILILNHFRFRNQKAAFFSFLFTVYLSGVYAIVGLPNVSYIRFELNLNVIPFASMLSDPSGTLLNVALFLPLGIFLPVLWAQYRNFRSTLFFGFGLSLVIELLQIFTFRATDVNDLITNTVGTVVGYGIGILLISVFPELKCRGKSSDLPLLALCTAAVMFFLQPLIWKILY